MGKNKIKKEFTINKADILSDRGKEAGFSLLVYFSASVSIKD